MEALGAGTKVKLQMDATKFAIARLNLVIQANSQHKIRLIPFSPSPMLGEVADFEESAIEDSIHPCALCGKPFFNKDVIMASCGCFYHPWCILTQNGTQRLVRMKLATRISRQLGKKVWGSTILKVNFFFHLVEILFSCKVINSFLILTRFVFVVDPTMAYIFEHPRSLDPNRKGHLNFDKGTSKL